MAVGVTLAVAVALGVGVEVGVAVAVAVGVGVTLAVAVAVGVGVGVEDALVHCGNLKLPTRVCQLSGSKAVVELAGMYSFVYQNVQSSVGSTVMSL